MDDKMRKRGVLIISHGSREQAWVDLVDEAIQQLPLRETSLWRLRSWKSWKGG
ncbi:hypothetical protein VQ056_27675 [Paenibacillus sp. JTLBN-2024]